MCLQQVARALKQNFRRSSDFVARYGGEEFVVLATAMDQQQAGVFAAEMCERVRGLAIPHEESDAQVVTLSMGYATAVPSDTDTADVVLGLADQALYRAKSRGRNQAVAA
jgi:diguanylate cyclase (GGDEF)-like protein